MSQLLSKLKTQFRLDKNKRYHTKYPYAQIISHIRERSKTKGLECTINCAWAHKTYTGYCSITGLQFIRIRGHGNVNAYHPSVDRIDPNKGYTPDNCRWVLFAINCFKNKFSDDDMYYIANAMLNNVNIISSKI